MILAVHLLTVKNGEVYLHHFWLIVFLLFAVAVLISDRS